MAPLLTFNPSKPGNRLGDADPERGTRNYGKAAANTVRGKAPAVNPCSSLSKSISNNMRAEIN